MNRLVKSVAKGSLLATDDQEQSAVFLLSNGRLDRDQETVDPRGIDFSDYMKRNPVVLFNHQADRLPIGKTTDLWIDTIDGADCLVAKVRFSKANPQARMIYDMIREGTLRGASISFLPIGRPEKNRAGGTHYPKASLLEWSVVPIGSNIDAVVLSKRLKSAGAGAAEAEDDLPPTLVEDSLRQVIAEMSWMRDHSEGLDDEQRARLNDCIARLEQALAEHPDYRPGMQNAKAFRPGGAELSARAKALVRDLNAVDEAFLADPEAPGELKRITRAFRAKRVELWGDSDDDGLTPEQRAQVEAAVAEMQARMASLEHSFYLVSGRRLGEGGWRNGDGGIGR